MYSKLNSPLKIDLVFEYSKIKSFKRIIELERINFILDKSYWENIFSIWINIIIHEKSCLFSNIIIDKNYFSLGLQIINNKDMAYINKKWLKKDYPTDVLSFPIINEIDSIKNFEFIELGDIFISFEKALEQSYEYNNSFKEEIIWLVSHGFLHLLGWEHNKPEELEDMLNFQELLISKLN